MKGMMFMQGSDGSTASLALTEIPEFVPPEQTEEEKKVLSFDYNKEITIQCCSLIMWAPNGHRKELECLSRFGMWTAKGPVRMRMLKKAAMQEKRFVRTYHVVRDENGRFWYRRGDWAMVELTVDEGTRRLYDGR